MNYRSVGFLFLFSISAWACDSGTSTDDGGVDAASSDAGNADDAGSQTDAGSVMDAGAMPDAAVMPDAAAPTDAGAPVDATVEEDAGEGDAAAPMDAGPRCPTIAAPMPRVPDTATVLTDCATLCSARRSAAMSGSGSCPIGTVGPGPCMDRCEEMGTFSEATELAAEYCIETDPLCFQSLDSCVLDRLYPAAVPVSFFQSGSGFAREEGLRVVSQLVVSGTTTEMETTVCEGNFGFSWTAMTRPNAWAFFASGNVYIDLNADGMCSVTEDLSEMTEFTFNGNFDSPAYLSTLSSPLTNLSDICSRFGS